MKARHHRLLTELAFIVATSAATLALTATIAAFTVQLLQ